METQDFEGERPEVASLTSGIADGAAVAGRLRQISDHYRGHTSQPEAKELWNLKNSGGLSYRPAPRFSQGTCRIM